MSKHLLLDPAGTSDWRLADAVDLAELSRNLERAMEQGEIFKLPVVLADRPNAPIELLVNCKLLPYAALVEL